VSEIAREIASQPACWSASVGLAIEAGGALPLDGERVAAVGCGTSLFVARAFAARREMAGRGETDAFAASEFPLGRRYDRIVAITRSGTTTEVLRLLERVAGEQPSVAITAVGGSPAADLADRAVVLDFADERSIVQTRFATSALALLRAHLGEDLAPAIADAETALATDATSRPERFDRFVFLGHGWSVGLAEEAALKLREAAQVHTEAYPAMEYRHGSISLADARTFIWIFGSPDPTIVADAEATAATVRRATLDPMAELVMAQRLAVALAEARGTDPDRPRHLTRSVVLSGTVAGTDGGRDRIEERATRGQGGSRSERVRASGRPPTGMREER
jgi:fructoselysine-6-P-deglycase FrlB-like protein